MATTCSSRSPATSPDTAPQGTRLRPDNISTCRPRFHDTGGTGRNRRDLKPLRQASTRLANRHRLCVLLLAAFYLTLPAPSACGAPGPEPRPQTPTRPRRQVPRLPRRKVGTSRRRIACLASRGTGSPRASRETNTGSWPTACGPVCATREIWSMACSRPRPSSGAWSTGQGWK
jgi:hypothetical protein